MRLMEEKYKLTRRLCLSFINYLFKSFRPSIHYKNSNNLYILKREEFKFFSFFMRYFRQIIY